jgi:MFS family permease
MQLVTPLLIKEWGIVPATMGYITTLSSWVGLIGVFVFPALADLYGRRPILILTILGYSLFTGFTGLAQGRCSCCCSPRSRVTLQGETPVRAIMVSETAQTRWRATALGGLAGGYPLGYMLCSLTALVVPLWGWRALYWLGILPALLVLWVRLGIKESPRFEHVTTEMVKEGLKKRLDIFLPVREYPREMLTATLLYFFYLFTWIAWSAWVPQYLANEKHLGFQTTPSYLSIWMFCAIFAYYLCGWLCDLFGRRYVVPSFVLPAAILRVVMGYLDTPASPFLGGIGAQLFDHWKLWRRPWLQYRTVPDADPRYCSRVRLHLRHRRRLDRPGDRRLDCDVAFDRGSIAAPRPIFLHDRTELSLRRPRNDAQRAHRLRQPKELIRHFHHRA